MHDIRVVGWVIGAATLASAARAEPQPFLELYAPAHFGNWYEAAGEREMRAELAEAKARGYTRYGDWFDTLDCASPFSNDRQYDLGNALWDRKKAAFLAAQQLGLETDLVLTPNHVFRDQLKPDWLARSGGRAFGQLICPSVPAARAAILDNCRREFSELAQSGIHLSAINCAPYDYGGCQCDRCQPWITTFAALCAEIHAEARRLHPGVQLQFIGWWWTAEEHQQFAAWMDEHAPGLAAGMALHIPYDQTSVPEVVLPRGCARHAFVHIGYGEQSRPADVYGQLGPVAAAGRLEQTVRSLRARAVQGATAYSEGILDDVNKWVLSALWTGRQTTAETALAEYARRHLGATDKAAAEAWTHFLLRWGRPFNVDAAAEATSFAALSGDPAAWRRRQWELKVALFAANQAVLAETEWTPRRLARAETFWAVRETLHRSVWGLGPQRHVLADRYIGLPWYSDWVRQRGAAATRPGT